jgi:methyl-accepting chemotaxis protein
LLTEISKGDGDLSKRIEVESNDELGKLASSFNHFVGSLEVTVLSIRQASDSIVTATDEVAAGNENLSSRTEETSSSLQRTSAVLAQIAEEASRSAENARDADSLARAAHGTAERGGAVMESVQRTMDSIDDSSRRIGAIIGVIDGIAFQTNILALNAAVEAARAGEHGRGFAVVAAEVRSLALRSADAAKQVRELIAESMHQTESGAALVRTAVHTVQEIRNGVSGVAQLIEGISSRTRQQSDGIGAVNATVSQLDTMTQQNAALVEEVSSAAESLKEQANALTLAVGRFKLS